MKPSPLFDFTSDELIKLGIGQWGYVQTDAPLSYLSFVNWVKNGHHGPLGYLADERMEKRSSLKNIFPACESALVFIFPYTKTKKIKNDQEQRIAGYTTGFEGDDYHDVIRQGLGKIAQKLQTQDPSLATILTVDVEPILERDLAYQAGLGWIGKNSMLIHPLLGSFFMIGSILLSKKFSLEQKKVNADYCGQCQLCLSACPTQAIIPGQRQLIASRCISTFTIEQFKPTKAPDGISQSDYQIFGCDICQDVCPWNRKPVENAIVDPSVLPAKLELITKFFLEREPAAILSDLGQMSNREFKKKFAFTALARTGRVGLMKNIAAMLDGIESSKKYPDSE